MKRKKSGVDPSILIVLIILIAFAFIYLVWLKDFRIFGENLSDYIICKNSNLENAKLKLKIPYTNQLLTEKQGNRCRTEYLNIPKGKEIDTIAKKMAACWDMYLEGKEELFDTIDNNYCAFCSVLTFEDKKELKGLTEYLSKNKVAGRGKTYYQYLTNTLVTKDVFKEIENSHLNDIHTIDTTKQLAVIFTMSKNAYPSSLTGKSSYLQAPIGFAAGAVIPKLLAVAGYGLCSSGIGCAVGSFLIVGAAGLAGGTIGYMIGSTNNPDLDTKILLWPYTNEDLDKLKCTQLEGKDRLDIRKSTSK